jgi:hypothetical protein
MFIRAFLTMVAADAVDRHMRDRQHHAWTMQTQTRTAPIEQPHRPEAVIAPARRAA